MANQEVAQFQLPTGARIVLVHGDITEEAVDAIVNAANSYLKHGGGVAAAIVRKGGKVIQEESDRIGYVPVGKAAMTTGGNLPARHVIHAVGPRWGEGDEDNKLRSAVLSVLQLATENGFQRIALPAISAGIFGFPKDRCADIILTTVRDYLENHPESSLKEVRIVLFDQPTLAAFQEAFKRHFQVS